MKFKKVLSMFLAASMCAGALSGCGGSAKDSAETTAQQSASGETTASAESSAESKPAGPERGRRLKDCDSAVPEDFLHATVDFNR